MLCTSFAPRVAAHTPLRSWAPNTTMSILQILQSEARIFCLSLTLEGASPFANIYCLAIQILPSSDTWAPKTGFACLNLTGHPEPTETCAFGSPGFDAAKSKSFQSYPNTSFSISYGDGEYLVGRRLFISRDTEDCISRVSLRLRRLPLVV